MMIASAVLAVVLAPPAAPAGCTTQFAPLVTASYSGDSRVPFWRASEAGEWRGSGWLGWASGGDRLIPVRFGVTPRQKYSPNDEDEVNVTTTRPVDFAIRCVHGVTAGPIVTVQSFAHDLAYDGPLQLTLGMRKYQLRVDGNKSTFEDARVILTSVRSVVAEPCAAYWGANPNSSFNSLAHGTNEAALPRLTDRNRATKPCAA